MSADQGLVVSTSNRELARLPGAWVIELKRKQSDSSDMTHSIAALLPPLGLADQAGVQAAPHSDRATPAFSDAQEHLDEILVSGERRTRDPREIVSWLQRLVGTFSYEGFAESVSVDGSALQQPVTGEGSCEPVGGKEALKCEMRIAAIPISGGGGVANSSEFGSRFNPAVVLFGLEPEAAAVRSLFVDNQGTAEPALGLLVGDTLVSRELCTATSSTCSRRMRITADPEGEFFSMHIDIESDGVRTEGYRFTMEKITQQH